MKYKSGSLKRKDTVNPNPISEKSSDNVNARAGDRLLSKTSQKQRMKKIYSEECLTTIFLCYVGTLKKKNFQVAFI